MKQGLIFGDIFLPFPNCFWLLLSMSMRCGVCKHGALQRERKFMSNLIVNPIKSDAHGCKICPD